ncbi:hypothetical protein CPA50_18340 [Marinobacter sp. ANT_B65]|nr:hypothetical protein CPA50_18340 [Marinobacter sp. ANT_B65]
MRIVQVLGISIWSGVCHGQEGTTDNRIFLPDHCMITDCLDAEIVDLGQSIASYKTQGAIVTGL